MNGYPTVVLAPVLGLVIYAIAHLLLAWATAAAPYRCLTVGFLCGLVTMLVTTAAAGRTAVTSVDSAWLCALNTLCYLALAFGYFNFINLAIASLRIRMLEELASCGGRLPIRHLEDSYGTEQMIGLRIDRLLRGGHVREDGGRLVSGRVQFLAVARIFDALRNAILGSSAPRAPRIGEAGIDMGDRRA